MDLTNADRVVFPDDGITKGDVFDYYGTVAGRLVPFLARRALTVERYPKGIGGGGFMQKNAAAHFPDGIGRFEVPKEGGGTTTYPVVDSEEGIAYFANLGVITFHVPPVTIDEMDHPDWVIWDLDPPEGRVDLVRDAARALRAVLERFDIPTVLMTSGSKGYHLRARLDRDSEWGVVANAARGVAALAAEAHPDLMTLAFRKAERGDRVFVDWLRNAPLATSVAPWSLRARPGAPVAVPLVWEEIDTIAPDGIGLHAIEKRLEADPWAALEPIGLAATAHLVDRALDEAGIHLEPFDRFRS